MPDVAVTSTLHLYSQRYTKCDCYSLQLDYCGLCLCEPIRHNDECVVRQSSRQQRLRARACVLRTLLLRCCKPLSLTLVSITVATVVVLVSLLSDCCVSSRRRLEAIPSAKEHITTRIASLLTMPPASTPASGSVATPPPPLTKKTIARPLKYHERPAFLRKESSFDIALGSCLAPDASVSTGSKEAQTSHALPPAVPWFLGHDVSESLRLAATLTRSVERAALQTRPFSWGYSATDGASAHNNTRRVVNIQDVAFFRRQIVRSVAAGNRLSLFLTGASLARFTSECALARLLAQRQSSDSQTLIA